MVNSVEAVPSNNLRSSVKVIELNEFKASKERLKSDGADCMKLYTTYVYIDGNMFFQNLINTRFHFIYLFYGDY